MDVTMIETTEFKKLLSKVENIETTLRELRLKRSCPTKDEWLDNQDVMQLLNISKRLLQTYRDENVIPFSKINNKIYYKASDIQKLLEKHYTKIVNF
jgi:hypothetical protein